MSSGAKIQTLLVEETTPGTTPDPATWDFLRLTGNTLTPAVGTESSSEIRDSRMGSGSIITSRDFTGDLNYEFSARTFDKLLPAAFFSSDWAADQSVTAATIDADGSDNSLNDTAGLGIFEPGELIRIAGFATTGNNGFATVVSSTATKLVVSGITLSTEAAGESVTLDNGDKIGIGATRHTFSAVKRYADISVFAIFRGLHVGSMSLDIPEEGIVTGTFSMAGLAGETAQTDFVGGSDTVNAATSTVPMGSATNVGTIAIDGASLAGTACISAMTMELANNLQVQRCLGKVGPGAQIETQASVTGTITMAWSAASYAIWKNMITREPIDIIFPLIAGGDAYAFRIPQAEVDGELPDGGNEDIVQVELNYTAKIDPVTVHRILAA
ncbi:MAG TPA: phage tail tube protein [Modicisalibacter sp.]|nr:phage tail tube protein [Modicisalibacter sp.]